MVKTISLQNSAWLKNLLLMAGALITMGILVATIRSNTIRIDRNEQMLLDNSGDIRELMTEIKYIRTTVDEIKKEVRQ